jgi:uncharacterized protein (DUF486 family)
VPVTAAIITSETILLQVYSIGNVKAYSRGETVPVIVKTSVLLALSNIFMTFAWYAHLIKKLNHQKWYIAALVSWGIALFEYLIQIISERSGRLFQN